MKYGQHAKPILKKRKCPKRNILIAIFVTILCIIAAILGFIIGADIHYSELATVLKNLFG